MFGVAVVVVNKHSFFLFYSFFFIAVAVNGCVVVEVKVCGDRCGKTSIYIYMFW